MELALIGLGRMGLNMAKRLLNDHHRLVVYDRSPQAALTLPGPNIDIADSIADIKQKLDRPRIAWVMVPHGDPTDAVIDELALNFDEGDTIIDGGNSHFLTSIERGKKLHEQGINFLDIGVSGGVFGLARGYCLMIGGHAPIVQQLKPIFISLAPGKNTAAPTSARTKNHSTAHEGYYHCGPNGAGHYVKMIHNAIEYGMMQSYAEGFELLASAASTKLAFEQRFEFDLREISELWRRGSVINSWLLDLTSEALHKNPHLDQFDGMVPDSGEGRWALIEAIKQGSSCPSLSSALFTRFRSQKAHAFSEKILSAMRKEFGGHPEGQKS